MQRTNLQCTLYAVVPSFVTVSVREGTSSPSTRLATMAGTPEALERPFKAARQLLRAQSQQDDNRLEADKLAGTIWRTHHPTIIACIEGEHKGLRPAAIGLLATLVACSPVVARQLLQELERAGARADRGLRQAEASGSLVHQAAAVSLALVRTRERSVLLRLLGGEHRRLASAPLRLLPKLPVPMQLDVLVAFRSHVLLASGVPLRSRMAPALSTLEFVVELYAAGGAAADAAHAHLLLVLTCLAPAVVASRSPQYVPSTFAAAAAAAEDESEHITVEETDGAGGSAHASSGSGGGGGGHASPSASSVRSGAEDALLRALLALRPSSDSRQMKLLLSTLHALPPIRAAYVRLRDCKIYYTVTCIRGWRIKLYF